MKYYNAIVPDELVEKLYKAGCPNIGRYERDGEVFYSETFYAEVFDGLMEKGLAAAILVLPSGLVVAYIVHGDNTAVVMRKSWHEAANAAIEKAIEILKEK